MEMMEGKGGVGGEGGMQVAVKVPVRAEECLGFAAFIRSGPNGHAGWAEDFSITGDLPS